MALREDNSWVSVNSGLLEPLDEQALEALRRTRLAEGAGLADDQGHWLEVPVLVAAARRAAEPTASTVG